LPAALTAALPAALPATGPTGPGGELLRLLVELPFALVRAENVVLTLKLGFRGSLLIIYLHPTNRIRLHCHVFFSLV
jgi:hypothetical protein